MTKQRQSFFVMLLMLCLSIRAQAGSFSSQYLVGSSDVYDSDFIFLNVQQKFSSSWYGGLSATHERRIYGGGIEADDSKLAPSLIFSPSNLWYVKAQYSKTMAVSFSEEYAALLDFHLLLKPWDLGLGYRVRDYKQTQVHTYSPSVSYSGWSDWILAARADLTQRQGQSLTSGVISIDRQFAQYLAVRLSGAGGKDVIDQNVITRYQSVNLSLSTEYFGCQRWEILGGRYWGDDRKESTLGLGWGYTCLGD